MTCEVSIVMGSRSDWQVMQESCLVLEKSGISFEHKIVSAHRTPERLYDYAKGLEGRGVKVVIAGAGGAAHLPGMVASLSVVPVLGVPVLSRALRGVDSLLSIVQMPAGVPVATFAIGKAGAVNAALFAIGMIGVENPTAREFLRSYREDQTAQVGETPE